MTDLLTARGIRYVTYEDWQRLDEIETELGKPLGKPRKKFTSVESMLEALG